MLLAANTRGSAPAAAPYRPPPQPVRSPPPPPLFPPPFAASSRFVPPQRLGDMSVCNTCADQTQVIVSWSRLLRYPASAFNTDCIMSRATERVGCLPTL